MGEVYNLQSGHMQDYQIVHLTELTDECIKRIADAVVRKIQEHSRRKEKWVLPRFVVLRCSKCGYINNWAKEFRFCPNCGEKLLNTKRNKKEYQKGAE